MRISCREFNQRIGMAQKAADTEPVFITNRGKPAYVLLSHAQYRRLTGKQQNAMQALSPPPELADALDGIDFELPERSKTQRRSAGFGA